MPASAGRRNVLHTRDIPQVPQVPDGHGGVRLHGLTRLVKVAFEYRLLLRTFEPPKKSYRLGNF